jgi:NADPH2:quinone reductase
MRALVVEAFAPFGTHAIREFPDPVPGPGEVIIDTRAMGLNFPDVLMVEGKYQHRPERPFFPGFDAAGVVSAIGAGVTRAAVGDRVLTSLRHGAFTTRVTAPEHAVWRMPEAMSFEDGAAFGLAYLTAYISLIVNARAQAGETVLITGASGGVGIAMTQFGVAKGMRIIGGVTSAEKAVLVQENGADTTVDLADANLFDSLRDEIYAVTDGEGVDLVADLVGGDVFDAALRSIRPGGRIAIIGFASGRIPEIKANYLLMKRLSAIGSPLTSGRPMGRNGSDALKDEAMAELFRLYEAGGLRPVITERLAFDHWRAAFRRFKERRVTGKIVMVP